MKYFFSLLMFCTLFLTACSSENQSASSTSAEEADPTPFSLDDNALAKKYCDCSKGLIETLNQFKQLWGEDKKVEAAKLYRENVEKMIKAEYDCKTKLREKYSISNARHVSIWELTKEECPQPEGVDELAEGIKDLGI